MFRIEVWILVRCLVGFPRTLWLVVIAMARIPNKPTIIDIFYFLNIVKFTSNLSLWIVQKIDQLNNSGLNFSFSLPFRVLATPRLEGVWVTYLSIFFLLRNFNGKMSKFTYLEMGLSIKVNILWKHFEKIQASLAFSSWSYMYLHLPVYIY